METQYSRCSAYDGVDSRRSWKPGFLPRLPWLGLLALLGAICGIAAAVGILVTSDGNPITSWTIQPTVWLSVATTATNMLLHFALAEGVNVAWWRQAMRQENNLADLHRNWDFGNSLWAALNGRRHINLVALACILTSIVPVSNPLLQRASRVIVATETATVTLGIPLAPEIPRSYTSYISGHMATTSLFTTEFSSIAQDFYNREDIRIADTGCEGSCRTTVRGAGLAVNCSTYTHPFELRTRHESAAMNSTQVFGTTFDWQTFSGNMSLGVQYKDTKDCFGNIIVENCTLRAATVHYPVVINGNRSTISLNNDSTIFADQVEGINQVSDSTMQWYSTFGGIFRALSERYNSRVDLQFVSTTYYGEADGRVVGYEVTSSGVIGMQYAVTGDHDKLMGNLATSCLLRFNNPTDDLLASARELMFRTAVAAANSSDVQYVTAEQTRERAVYESQYLFLAVALFVVALTVGLVTMTFSGYWHLGRNMTMSPIEIAKAFNAHLLRDEDSNAEVKDIVKRVGNTPVRYGVVLGESETRSAARPAKGTTQINITEMPWESRGSCMRLELAGEGMPVQEPEAGWKFAG